MIPGVGFFYSGLLRRKNALSLIFLSVAVIGVVSFQVRKVSNCFFSRPLMTWNLSGSSGVTRSRLATVPMRTSVTSNTSVSRVSTASHPWDPHVFLRWCLLSTSACSPPSRTYFQELERAEDLSDFVPFSARSLLLVASPNAVAWVPPLFSPSFGLRSSTIQLPAGHGTLQDGHSLTVVSILPVGHPSTSPLVPPPSPFPSTSESVPVMERRNSPTSRTIPLMSFSEPSSSGSVGLDSTVAAL